MLVFSEKHYVPTISNVFTIPVNEGYVYIDKMTYDQLLILSSGHTYEPITDIEHFVCELPKPLNVLVELLDFATFDIPVETESVIGTFSVMLMNVPIHSLLPNKEHFLNILSYSSYVLKEYKYPWESFLSQCINYDELCNPSPLNDKHIFLTLHPSDMIPQAVTAAQAQVTEEEDIYAKYPDVDRDVIDYALDKERNTYLGNGLFANNELGEFEEYSLTEREDEVIKEIQGFVEPDDEEFKMKLPIDPEPITEPVEEVRPEVENSASELADIRSLFRKEAIVK